MEARHSFSAHEECCSFTCGPVKSAGLSAVTVAAATKPKITMLTALVAVLVICLIGNDVRFADAATTSSRSGEYIELTCIGIN